MTKYKVINLSETENRRVSLGTVDRNDPKSFYLIIASWVAPNTDIPPKLITKKIASRFNEVLQHNKLTDVAFMNLDLRESGLRKDKKSFMSCEMTFLNNKLPFNNIDMRNLLDELLVELDDTVIFGDTDLSFSARK